LLAVKSLTHSLLGELLFLFRGDTAGQGVGKVEPGSEKILDVGLNFKIGICLAHSRSGVELEKLRFLCEAYAQSIKRDHK